MATNIPDMKKQENMTKQNTSETKIQNIEIDGSLQYNDYIGSIEYSKEDNMFYGKVLYINDAILFEGETIKELYKDFEEGVKHYLAICKAEGTEPNKPMSGTFNVRTSPEYHYKLSVISKRENLSLNKIVNEAISYFIKEKGLMFEGK